MDLRLNVPPQPAAAELEAQMASAIARLQQQGRILDLLNYGSTGGTDEDRQAGALWLRPRLDKVAAEDVLICAGGASLLVALLTTLTDASDAIVAEAITYPGIRAVSRHFGRPLVGVAMDSEGIIPSALARACERVRPRVLYCTPTIQNPTTATMSVARRTEIAAVARQFDLLIFEDDAYGLLPDAGPPPLATFAPERTFYLASVSKSLSPGLRVAYSVVPEAYKEQVMEGLRVVTLLAPQLMVAIVSQWITDGSATAILNAIRSECVARQTLAREILDPDSFVAAPEGPHLWLSLSDVADIADLGTYLRANGVAAKGDGFTVDGGPANAIRVALGAQRSREDVISSLQFLEKSLDEWPTATG